MLMALLNLPWFPLSLKACLLPMELEEQVENRHWRSHEHHCLEAMWTKSRVGAPR